MQGIQTSPQPADANASTTNGPSAGILLCPQCGTAALVRRHCKTLCEACGYVESCEDNFVPTTRTLDDKYANARGILRPLRRVAVAFSAGVDSTLVLKLAVEVLGKENVVAVTGRSDSVPRAELDEASRLAGTIGVELVFLDTDEFENQNYRSNPANRCYFCKTTLYEHLDTFIAKRGLHAAVNGTNADDLGDYRPGLQAADEHHVRSPLAEAGLTKHEVRELSRRLGLATHDKPAGPCLSSRVQYGEEITPEKLRRIEQAEALLHSLGIRECRVRHHHDLARIEVSAEAFAILTDRATARRVDQHFRALGYQYVTLDLRGFRSGSLNEVIAFGKRQGEAEVPG